jgi:glycosyltransferase involved in cell wall biosynthesis
VTTSVAIDVGALVGPRTGIGRFVAQLVHALETVPDPPQLRPYVLSLRAPLPAGALRLRWPAGPTLRSWGRVGRPRHRRALRGVSVVHGTNYVVPPWRGPRVVTVHDCSLITRPELVNTTVHAFVPVLRRAVRTGAWVHTPSTFVADQVRELFGTERVRAIHHGPPEPVVTSGSGASGLPGLNGRPYVLALAAREPRKNLVRLVEAFAAVGSHRPQLSLVLMGPPGPDQPRIEATIESLPHPVAERVLLTDWVDDHHRAAALRGAQALAYPSLDEGFGLPLLEAMQAGVPVVAADVGAIPEVAGDAALLVDPLDVDALAGALATAVDDDTARAGLVARGHQRVDEFSWNRSARAMADLYRDVERDQTGR